MGTFNDPCVYGQFSSPITHLLCVLRGHGLHVHPDGTETTGGLMNHETWVKILETQGYPAFVHRISRKPVYRNVVLTIKQRDILHFCVKPIQKLQYS